MANSEVEDIAKVYKNIDENSLSTTDNVRHIHKNIRKEHKKRLIDLVHEYLPYTTFTDDLNLEQICNLRTNIDNTPLMYAAMNGHFESLQFLARHGADLSAVNYHGYTALHLSAKYDGKIPPIDFLVSCGCEVKFEDSFRGTPLNLASTRGNVDIINTLVKHGTSVNHSGRRGYTPLHSAAHYGGLYVLECLLKHNVNIDARNDYGNTPLILAASCRYTECVIPLVQHGADVNARNNHGFTALHLASRDGLLNTVTYLLQSGHDVDGKNFVDDTPLAEAVSNGHLDVAKILLQYGACVNAKCKNGMTPLSRHAFCGIKGDISYKDLTGDQSIQILFRRIYDHSLDIVQLLVQKGAWVNAIDNFNNSVLINFLQYGCRKISIIQYLLDSGADVNYRNDDGATALMFSVDKAHILKVILDRGGNVNDFDNCGNTALHKCSELSELNYLESVQILLSHGAELNSRNFDGNTPLMLCQSKDMLEYLIKHRACINVTNNKGQTELHIFADQRNFPCVKFLLKIGCDVDVKDSNGNTPLLLVSQKNTRRTRDMLKILINHGCCINITNNYGHTALYYASKTNSPDLTVKLLVREMIVNTVLNIKMLILQ